MNFLLSFCLLISISIVKGRIEPEKIVHNGVYRLEIQSEDKWLTGITNEYPVRSSWRGNPEQKWRFEQTTDSASGQVAWRIAPINNVGGISTLWRVTYVGHGKFEFKSFASGLCLRGTGGGNRVSESKCQRDDPLQRWLVKAAM